jgi:hypothetical protein
MSDATPIQAAKTPHKAGDQIRRRPRRNSTVSLGTLNDPDRFQGFTTHDLISGLHGVCAVLDSEIVGTELEYREGTICDLAIAAKVLSAILRTEVHS